VAEAVDGVALAATEVAALVVEVTAVDGIAHRAGSEGNGDWQAKRITVHQSTAINGSKFLSTIHIHYLRERYLWKSRL
jgi:hypothetical protein